MSFHNFVFDPVLEGLKMPLWGNVTLAHVVASVAILLVGLFLIRLILGGLRRLMRTAGFGELTQGLFVKIARFILYIALVGLALAPLGVDLTSLVLGFGVLGVVVGFALKDVLANIFSGILIALQRPFDKGDFVEVGGVSGFVEELGTNATILRTPDGKRVIVPSSRIWNSPITNYDAYPSRRLDLPFYTSYEEDVGRAMKVVLALLENHEGVAKDPPPFINLKGFAPGRVDLEALVWCRRESYQDLRNDLLMKIKAAL